MKEHIALNQNPLVTFLKKMPAEFTKADIIKYVEENDIKIINFYYLTEDGRLKVLNFSVTNRNYLEQLLSTGEIVNGSKIFPDFIHTSFSDFYIIPRFRTAFIDPFSEIPTLCFLGSFFNKDGKPMENSPEYVLKKATDSFVKVTGMSFEAMAELEYCVIAEKEKMCAAMEPESCHDSNFSVKFEQFRAECILHIAKTGGLVKYGHSENEHFILNDKIYAQSKIGFLMCDVQGAADQLIIAKWIIRSLAYKYGLNVTFAPKVAEQKTGNGLYVHTRIMKGGRNQMVTKGKLNSIAKTAIAGYMKCASSLTAFGNTNPASYLRLLSHQEVPEAICWGDGNRSTLVRIPLGWTHKNDMLAEVNPLEKVSLEDFSQKQTMEFRSSDGSADIYLLMAGLVVAARYGFEMEGALDCAKETYINMDIHSLENTKKLKLMAQLPVSCWESADELSKHRDVFEKHGVFNSEMIDDIVKRLKSFNDKDLRIEVEKDPQKMLEIIHKYIYKE